jgi:hypothetical protein
MMAVNPEAGTSSLDAAATALEGLFGGDEVDSVEEPEVEETEEPEAPEGDEPEGEADDDAEPDEEETDEEIETLEQLAEATGRSVDDLLAALKTTVKVDGEVSEVTLDELRAGYQKDRDYRQKTEALKRDREAWEQQQAQIYEQVEQQHQIAAYILNDQERQLAEAMGSPEMARLKETNREQWIAKRFEFQDQLQKLQQTKHEAAQRLQQFRSQQTAEQEQKLRERLKEEHERLTSTFPKLDRGALTKYLTEGIGFTPQEVGQVYDHRLVVMAEKARLYDEQQRQSEAAVKQVKKAPKAPMPGKQSSPAKVKRSELQKVRARLKQTGKTRDAADYLLKSGHV